jgi:hypothetical protein
MHISDIAFMAFLDDTRQLVTDGVRCDVAHRILEARSPEGKLLEIARGEARDAHLKQWLAMDVPLSYGLRGETGAFQTLLHAVVSEEKEIAAGLPNAEENGMMSPTDFVNCLLNMSSPSSPSPLSAPVLRDGSFLPILKEAHRSLLSLSQQATPSNQRAFVFNHFFQAVDRLKIRFVPFHLPRSHSRGPPRKKLVYNSWMYLGLRESRSDLPLPPSEPLLSHSQIAAGVAHANAIAADSNTDWCAKGVSLRNLHTILHYTRLPSDFATISPAKAQYVDDTYAWVRSIYDGTKPIHHLALIVGVIASALLPNLFLPTDSSLRARFAQAHTESQVRDLYNSLPWVSRNKKGMKETSIFITMFTTYIIALYEPASPLRQHIDSSSKKGLGNPWTDKHCMCSLSSSLLVHSQSSFLLAVKGISYTTLIRFGVFWGKGAGAFDKGTFGVQWGCHPPAHVKILHDEVVAALKRLPHGPYHALSMLIGQPNALLFCKGLGVSYVEP